jgi:hypothetical protein
MLNKEKAEGRPLRISERSKLAGYAAKDDGNLAER